MFLTAHSVDEADILKGYGVGGVDYLSKPINAEILRSKVGVFVEAFRKARALADLNAALQHEVARREAAQAALEIASQQLEQRVQERTAALTHYEVEYRATKPRAEPPEVLVELHGGTISAESGGQGHGSAFTVRFPIARVRAAARPH